MRADVGSGMDAAARCSQAVALCAADPIGRVRRRPDGPAFFDFLSTASTSKSTQIFTPSVKSSDATPEHGLMRTAERSEAPAWKNSSAMWHFRPGGPSKRRSKKRNAESLVTALFRVSPTTDLWTCPFSPVADLPEHALIERSTKPLLARQRRGAASAPI